MIDGLMMNGFGTWLFSRRQNATQMQGFQRVLSTVWMCKEVEDNMAWTDNITCQFSVKSCYNRLLNEQNENWCSPEILVQLKRSWKSKVQSKIHIFC